MKNNTSKETITSLHRKKLHEIEKDEAELPALGDRKSELVAELKTADPIQSKNIEIELKDLAEKMQHIQEARVQYYLRNAELLYKFNETDKDRKSTFHNMDVLKQPKVPLNQQPQNTQSYYRQFRSNIDPNYVYVSENNINEENYCFACKAFRVLNPDEACMICETCGEKTTVVSTPEKPSMKDPPVECKYYEYERYTHFCGWLSNLQGKESSKVPDEVINAVIREISREKMQDNIDELSEHDIRRYLKKYSRMGYFRYYEHATQILFRITDIKPIQMTPKMEQNLKLMFLEVQEPFNLYKGSKHNFSSYAYIIYKFCQLLGYKEFLPKLKLHKEKIKLYEHDRVWKQICEHLGGEAKGWKFIKSYEY